MSAVAIVGGQYGSEGKGLIVGHIARQFDHHIRVGAANAGHTFYTKAPRLADSTSTERFPGDPIWEKHVMQQIPCAAYANPDAELYVGPGALISPDVFARELQELDQWRRARGLENAQVYVDPRAHVISVEQVMREAAGTLQERIGSTSATAREGIGTAQADRVMREPWCTLAGEWVWEPGDGVTLRELPETLDFITQQVLLEGTQGTGLSLTTGDFPYTTSRNTTAAGLCADTGCPPVAVEEVGLIMRTYPIRVAGNSGPFYNGSDEISWESIGIDSENERTTVTKKIRRVATFSIQQAIASVQINGASWIALTFCDYLDPKIAGVVGYTGDLSPYPEVKSMVETIQWMTGVGVKYLGTGPHSVLEVNIA